MKEYTEQETRKFKAERRLKTRYEKAYRKSVWVMEVINYRFTGVVRNSLTGVRRRFLANRTLGEPA